MRNSCFFFLLLFFLEMSVENAESASNYGEALTKSILYFEAQRSGNLPTNQRVKWRADSALADGSDVKVDLVGGYYDSGDNVKFGFPMAFTMTTLAWGVVEYEVKLKAKGELSNALAAIKWGTDYLVKASKNPSGVLYGEVGDGDSDHSCWQRPEDMTTPRTSYKIDANHPGSDLAAETAAALTAASIAFKSSNSDYSTRLLNRAKKLFDFARRNLGLYSNSIWVASKFYHSSGYDDELLWAAAWLHRATGNSSYLNLLSGSTNIGGIRTMFSWDDKFLGAQILASKLVLEGKVRNDGVWANYKKSAEMFLCNFVQKGHNNKTMSPGGMVWWDSWNNFQYTTSALLALTSYSDYLAMAGKSLFCPSGTLSPEQLISFASSQVDYILGANPKGMSYMVGYGWNYPKYVHHRGASIPSIKISPAPIDCNVGFNLWFHRNEPNPNVLIGAIVGGPDANDDYIDNRENYQQAEPAIVNIAPLIGVLARL